MVSFSQPQGQLERKRSSNAGFNTTTHVDTKDKRGAKSGKILQADSGGGDLYINHFNAELKKLSSNILHLDARLAACSQLAHLLYHGAILEEYVLENQKVFDVFIAILGGSYEPFALRLQAIQTFSVLCRSSDGIQKILCDRKTVDLLIKLIIEGYEDMVKLVPSTLQYSR
ncbi:hypothetical protein BC829DRAFT_219579 [Chytridium lagenaria]|nr:hypothetical protein BC829DRAFT_219579 [Chytridium lagenaria]